MEFAFSLGNSLADINMLLRAQPLFGETPGSNPVEIPDPIEISNRTDISNPVPSFDHSIQWVGKANAKMTIYRSLNSNIEKSNHGEGID
jgi:hypothetical protein